MNSPPVEVVLVCSPSSVRGVNTGYVMMEHYSATGYDERIIRLSDDAVPLFWRFILEKFGVEPLRSTDPSTSDRRSAPDQVVLEEVRRSAARTLELIEFALAALGDRFRGELDLRRRADNGEWTTELFACGLPVADRGGWAPKNLETDILEVAWRLPSARNFVPVPSGVALAAGSYPALG